jgi:hypothetical protein
MPVQYKLLKFIGFCALLWPLSAVILPFSGSVSFFSAAPILMGWICLTYIICFGNFPRSSIAYFILFLALLAVISPMILFAESDFFRSVKTFVSPALFFVLIYIVSFSRKQNLSNNWLSEISFSIFNVALGVSLFGLFEMLIKYYFPFIANYWYSLLGDSGFSGVEYLKTGYMDYGFIFQGQRPLGLFGDQHTSPLVALMCAIYFLSVADRLRFWLAIAAIILTFRWTYYAIIPILIFLQSRHSSNPVIVLFTILVSIVPIIFALDFVANDASGSVLIEHLLYASNLSTVSWDKLFFGIGYTGNLDVDLGFSEIFILKYITFFGISGVTYFILLTLMPAYVYIKSKQYQIGGSPIDSSSTLMNRKVYLVLVLVPLLGTIHYNAFFTPSVAFLYSLQLIIGMLTFKKPL